MRRRLHTILKGITRLSPRRKAGFICIFLLLLAYAFCLPQQLFRVPYSTVVTNRHGELLGARIAPDGQWRFPPCDTVPRKFVRCLLAFEDRHFYCHPGVNPLSMARAAWQNIRQGRIVSGGSTLTMQTIRISRNHPRTFAEKVVEMILATRLELRCSKDEILALYASHAPFGGNVVGLDAAAWRYFAHPASELSWARLVAQAKPGVAPALGAGGHHFLGLRAGTGRTSAGRPASPAPHRAAPGRPVSLRTSRPNPGLHRGQIPATPLGGIGRTT